MLFDLQLAKMSAHIPVRIFGSVAVTSLHLLQRSMRIAMSSKTLLSLELLFVALLASQKLALPHASRKKNTTGMALKSIHCISKGTAGSLWRTNTMSVRAFQGATTGLMYLWTTLWGLTEVITGLGRGCVFKTKNLLFAVQMWSVLMLQVAKKISSDHSK